MKLKVVKIQSSKELLKLAKKDYLTLSGVELTENTLHEICKSVVSTGYDKSKMQFITWDGDLMNRTFNLTCDNAYPKNVNFVCIENWSNKMYGRLNEMLPICDIVRVNEVTQKLIDEGNNPY